MGSLFKPKVPAAPPPPAETIPNTYVDQTTGVTSTPTKNPDGSYTITTKQNLTPEQQAQQDRISQMAADNLKRYDALANNYDISQIPGLSDAIKAYKQSNQIALDQAYAQTTRQQEDALARYGVTNSTAASEARGQTAGAYMSDTAQLGRDAYAQEQAVRQNEMNNALSGYNVAQGALNNQQAQQAGMLSLGSNITGQLNNLQAQRNNLIYQGNLAQQQLQFQANQAQQQTLGAIAGLGLSAATGGLGGMGGLGGGTFGAGGVLSASGPMSASRSSQLGIKWN